MNIKKSILIVASLVLVALSSCEDEDSLGPDIEGIGAEPVPTTTFTASTETVNFLDGERISFAVDFERATNWRLTLTGQNSGAITVFEDVSSSIFSENSLWDGTADAVPFFQAEEVIATVDFPNFPDSEILLDTFTITGIEGALIESVLYSDFSVVTTALFQNEPDPETVWVRDFPLVTNTNTQFPLFDNNPYLYFEGNPRDVGNPFINVLQMDASLGDTLTDQTLPLFSNPDRVFVNIAIYNTETENTWFRLSFAETNGGDNGDERFIDIVPDWVGWNFISIRYSDLLSNQATVYNPSIIGRVDMLLFTNQDDFNGQNGELVSVAVDQLVFSFDSPLGTVNF